MSTEVTFTIPGEPVSKARARFTNHGGKSRAYTPRKVHDAEERVAWAFKAAGGRFEPDAEATFGVRATFHNGTRQRRDVDNMLKLILDGLNGIAWVDDTQVMEVAGRKTFVPRAEARTEVEIYHIGAMDRLTATCQKCGRDFRTYESWIDKKRYCSQECRGNEQREKRTKPCEQCGEEYTFSPRGHGMPESRWCSSACRSAHGHLTLRCSVCGNDFETYRSWVRKVNYCSDDCRRVVDAQAHRERRTKTFPGKCLVCGTGTTRKEYKRCNPCKLAGKQVPA